MKCKQKSSLLAALVIAALCQPVWAAEPDITQTRPGDGYNLDAAMRQKPAPPDTRSPVEKPDESVQPEQEQGSDVKFLLTKLNIDPSEILTKAEITAITAKYEGREVSVKEVNAAVQEINQLYAQKQNVIARAVLLPQKVQDGVVNIKLAESHVGKYRIEGTKYTSDEYLTQRMALKGGDLLKLDQLEQDVIRFNKTNGMQLKVVLIKGEKFGTTDVILKAAEQPRQEGVLFSDNAGSESTGEYRQGAVWTLNSLCGGGDSLSLNTTYSRGNTGGGISYQVPIDYMGTQLGFSYSKNQDDIVSGLFQSLQISGESTDASISINHPFTTTLSTKRNLYGEIHQKKSDTYFSDVNLQGFTVKSAVLGLSEQKYYSRGMIYQNFSLTTGYAYTDFNATNTRQAFSKFNFSYANRMAVKNNCAILLRASGQYNGHRRKNLSSTEQFTLGGFSTVRGYKEGALPGGDSGYFLSGEFHFPMGKTEGVAFIDHGGAFSYNGETTPNNRDCYLTSMGVGVIASIAKNTSLQVFLGVPIVNGKYNDGARCHFYLQHLL